MLRKTILSQSLLVAFAATSLSLAVAPTAYAQSTTVGSVFGEVSGQAGSQLTVENPATGLKRSTQIDAKGLFSIGSLPPGKYVVSVVKGGTVISKVDVEVLAGRGSEAIFESSKQLETVTVTGRVASIDTSRAENVSTFTASQLNNIPLATKDLNGIIGLAANTTKADSRYAGGISIGGGAPSENAYYINGLPVTNALTQLGSIELPVGAIRQADVQTGGFGAEFGRSVGGVVNVTTKSGTNEWQGGVGYSIEPDALRSIAQSSYYPNTGSFPGTDGKIYINRAGDSRTQTDANFYVGGPIIKDKLFFFFAGERIETRINAVSASSQSSAVATTGWDQQKSTNDRYMGKFDWFVTPEHHLEATFLGDNYKTTDNYYGYSYATGTPGAASYSQYSTNLAGYTPGVGGDAQALKYTGNLTEDLTISALFGQTTSKHKEKFSFDPSQSQQVLIPTSLQKNPTLNYPTAANPLPGGTTGIPDGAKDKTTSFRFDVEYQLGNHLLRAGLDENRLKSINAGESYAATSGGYYWRLYRTANGAYAGPAGAAALGPVHTLIQQGATPVNIGGTNYYYYARKRIFDTVTNAESNQSAQYIEDKWQATRHLLVTAGLRNEEFENKNGDGATFLKMKSFLSPRLSAAWDVSGDASFKVIGSLGRYSLQIPTHVSVRGASRSLYTDQFFAYSGVDPVTGVPTGLKVLNEAPYSGNNEYGQAKDPKTVAAQNMKPTYQDEMTLGFEKALSRTFTGGIKATYRTLKATIDDFCDPRPIDAYAAAHNISEAQYGGFGCATIDAGQANTLLVNYVPGTYTTVNLSAADLGLPKAKRTYTALDFFLEHSFRDGWYGKLTYTWSRSRGNTEGQTKSDNAQTDVATTSTWDFPEIMEGSYGDLPNDRRHQIKGYGYYQFTPELQIGSTFVAESGRPKNCFGDYGGKGQDIASGAYGAVFFYCSGVYSPRGSQGNLPWSTSLDMNATYKPAQVKGLSLRVDVFNLFDRQVARVIDEAHDSVATYGGLNPAYGRVISYSAPRKVRLSVNYDF